jgi:hypothetical protein
LFRPDGLLGLRQLRRRDLRRQPRLGQRRQLCRVLRRRRMCHVPRRPPMCHGPLPELLRLCRLAPRRLYRPGPLLYRGRQRELL